MAILSLVYAEVARVRRAWYGAHPEARRRLQRPVISVGNLSVGGTGKTPAVAAIARLLKTMGERPAVLARGYKRQYPVDGVVIVRDAARLRADLHRAGDEPLMLARALDEVPVLVSADRFVAGRLAEVHLGATVHLLDDGFQHHALERDVDLLVVREQETARGGMLYSDALRERLSAARAAHALLVADATPDAAAQLARRLHVARGFAMVRELATPRLVEPYGRMRSVAPGTRVLAVAGIARADRFFADLREAELEVAGELAFRDHHPYLRADVDEIVRRAHLAHVALVLTTEKDMVRLLPHRPIPAPLAWVPLKVTFEPEMEFRDWLRDILTRSGMRGREHR